MSDQLSFKQWIVRRRRELDLTREALATQAGCAPQTIRAFELGRRRPSRELAQRLADVLKVPVEERPEFVRLARIPADSDRGRVGPVEPGELRRQPMGEQLPSSPTTDLPSGTLTLVFTDIEESTRLLQALGERYGDVLRVYHGIIRAAMGERGGHEVDTQGDGCFLVFPRAVDALYAALAVQRALITYPWPGARAVRARIGMHTGEPHLSDGRYVGLDVHRAARIAAAGHGGQILLSAVTAGLVQDHLPPEMRLRDLGAHVLKDLEHAERILQLVAPELPADFPPLRTPGASPADLPPAPMPLVAIKLRVPSRRYATLVARPRLRARLDAALSRPLTVIAAPAGFGKTTLLSDWLSRGLGVGGWGVEAPSPNPQAVAWLALDAGDSDPVVFVRYLIAALQTIVPTAGAAILPLFNASQPPSIAAVLPLLVNDLISLPEPSVLVLDDYHLVESADVHQALAFLLDHLPPQLHLVIASRVDPPLPLSRLRVRGQLVELRAHDLRFTPDEAATFLQETTGLALTTEDVAALDARTEGWIAGLQLAALSLQDRADEQRAAFIAAFTGSHRFVVDYLVDEVLARQPLHIQTFLLHTSVLERLCGSLCDAVTGSTNDERATTNGDPEDALSLVVGRRSFVGANSQQLLEELERSNLFIVPLDDQRHWYRYHHLFAQVLRERLRSGASDATIADLHERASTWFEGQGLAVEAVEHALAAEDWERVARLVEEHGRFLVVSGRVHTVLGWLKPLPGPVLHTRPYLYVIHALGLFFLNDLEAAELQLCAAEEHLSAAEQDDRSRSIRGYATILRASIARYRGDLAGCVALARRGLEILPPADRSGRIAANVHVVGECMLRGDVSPANERLLVDVVADARTTGEINGIFYAVVALAGLQRRQGRLRQALITYREAGQVVADPNAIQALPNAASYYFGLGNLLRELNDFDAAADLLAQGRETILSMRLADAESIVQGYTALAWLQQTCGEGRRALATLDELHEVALERELMPALLARAAASRAQLALRQGHLPAAVEWASSSNLGADDVLSYPRELEYLALARVWIAQGRSDARAPLLDDALHLLDRLLVDAEAGTRMDSVIEIGILRALALQAQGRPNAALAALERALHLGIAEGYVRVFVDEGAPMAMLLAAALEAQRGGQSHQGQAEDARVYIQQLLVVLQAEGVEPNGTPQSSRLHAAVTTPSSEVLTEREREVLALLAAGRSNQAIGDELVVAIGTVKRHVNSIMGKLQAESRLEAVARARELGLA